MLQVLYDGPFAMGPLRSLSLPASKVFNTYAYTHTHTHTHTHTKNNMFFTCSSEQQSINKHN